MVALSVFWPGPSLLQWDTQLPEQGNHPTFLALVDSPAVSLGRWGGGC